MSGVDGSPRTMLNSSHWGVFDPLVVDGCVVDVRAFPKDPDPSPIIHSIPDAVHHASRVAQPAVREGWLKDGPSGGRGGRGGDQFIPVSWERALDLVERELKRVIATYGNAAIFGGSYGWSSAGRFHHAKTQLQRFLVRIGGFTGSKDTYSNAAGTVLVKRVVGDAGAIAGGPSWQSILYNTELMVMFGGVPIRNTQVTPGGAGEHTTRRWLSRAKEAGIKFCNISPIRDDAVAFLDAEWLAPRPNSDTAIILALAHTLIVEELYDADFLARYCVGFDRFRHYVLGDTDGVVKDAEWAAPLSELPAAVIRDLARRMARSRTLLMANWSLQRSDHGEQPFWALITLAAMLGQIGLPGGGFGFGYGSMGGLAELRADVSTPDLRIGENPIKRFIGQMDMGRVSQQSKIAGREPMRINTLDAMHRGIRDGDVVRVFNDRGAILVGAVVTEELRSGVIQISTGAWYDPQEPGVVGSLDKHGNPNVLTIDKGTSRLAQGPSAQTTLVEVEKYAGELPLVTVFDPPCGSGVHSDSVETNRH